jgi:hypothetical protein
MSRRVRTAFALVVLIGALGLLWLYEHKLWSTPETRALDSLLEQTAAESPSAPLPEPALAPPLQASAAGAPPSCPHCIAIALIGVDSRLGDPTAHADANHVLLLDLQQGRITIVAIPRDTPADAGFPDTSQYNKLANVRANRGLQAHLATLAELVGVERIHYYAEAGFSHALALFRLLGYEQPSELLRVLRARTGIWSDDYHRVFMQAHFLRQQLLRHWETLSTPWGIALLRAGLGLLHTNLTAAVVLRLADSLRARGFPTDSSAIRIVVYGVPLHNAPVYDLTAPEVVAHLAQQLRQYHAHRASEGDAQARVREHLESVLRQARAADSAGQPWRIRQLLERTVLQRAWWQLSDAELREHYRRECVQLLSSAYNRLRRRDREEALRQLLLQEDSTEALVRAASP